MTLGNQVAMVTGGSGGIGRAIAAALTVDGARVALLGRHADALEATRAGLGPLAGQAVAVPCDVTDRAQTERAVADVLARLGQIDIVVCAAGINIARRGLRSLDPADWDRVLATNLTGTFNVLHHVLPSMRERGSGLVIQISSISGIRASALAGAAYSASKFGQAALGVCIGREERGRGIRSTVIYPGEVDTPFLDARAGRADAVPASRREAILQPADVAAAVRFVAGLPPRAHVPELVIKPAIDDFA